MWQDYSVGLKLCHSSLGSIKRYQITFSKLHTKEFFLEVLPLKINLSLHEDRLEAAMNELNYAELTYAKKEKELKKVMS